MLPGSSLEYSCYTYIGKIPKGLADLSHIKRRHSSRNYIVYNGCGHYAYYYVSFNIELL